MTFTRRSTYEFYAGSPCASCAHMSWDHYRDEPGGFCKVTVRNRFGKPECGSRTCEKLGYKFFVREDWKAQKAEAWANKNSALTPENAVRLG